MNSSDDDDMRPQASGPLQGVKVVDFCSFIAGSYGAMVLGDFGADVIKVEPVTGDLARAWGPFLRGESRYFQGWNPANPESSDLRRAQQQHAKRQFRTDNVQRPGSCPRLSSADPPELLGLTTRANQVGNAGSAGYSFLQTDDIK